MVVGKRPCPFPPQRAPTCRRSLVLWWGGGWGKGRECLACDHARQCVPPPCRWWRGGQVAFTPRGVGLGGEKGTCGVLSLVLFSVMETQVGESRDRRAGPRQDTEDDRKGPGCAWDFALEERPRRFHAYAASCVCVSFEACAGGRKRGSITRLPSIQPTPATLTLSPIHPTPCITQAAAASPRTSSQAPMAEAANYKQRGRLPEQVTRILYVR